MTTILLGAVAAVVASTLYNVGLAVQALDARELPTDHGMRPALLGGLIRRPRWLAGTALTLVGWVAQVVALLLAPLALVQPALAAGLVPLMLIGAYMLHEPVHRRGMLGVAAIIAGVALLAWSAPDRTILDPGKPVFMISLAVIGLGMVVTFALAKTGRPV